MVYNKYYYFSLHSIITIDIQLSKQMSDEDNGFDITVLVSTVHVHKKTV